MARLRGRSPRGERCRAAVPHGHWKTTTLVAGLRLGGLTAPMVITATDAATAVHERWAIENRLRLRCSTSRSPTTSPGSARATALETWPPSATSPSTSSAPPQTSAPSSPAESLPEGSSDYLQATPHHSAPKLDRSPAAGGGRSERLNRRAHHPRALRRIESGVYAGAAGERGRRAGFDEFGPGRTRPPGRLYRSSRACARSR